MTPEIAAKKMRETANNVLKGKDSFTDDPVMQSSYNEDTADLNAIATLLEQGNLKEAKRAMEHLDTVVRDEIPDDVWDYAHHNPNIQTYASCTNMTVKDEVDAAEEEWNKIIAGSDAMIAKLAEFRNSAVSTIDSLYHNMCDEILAAKNEKMKAVYNALSADAKIKSGSIS